MNDHLTPMLSQSRVNSCFIFSEHLPVNYILNAKGGCSTILAQFWKILDDVTGQSTFVGDPHGGWPWGRVAECSVQQIGHISAKRTFTMVRNPFARALSAYLSKVGERNEASLYTWAIFCEHFGLDADATVSFEQYLDLIAREPLEMMDIHWAPQTRNLMQPAARIDKIFYMENSAELAEFLEDWSGKPMERYNKGPRDTLAHLNHYYTDRALDLVRRIYKSDFELFGYSEDPAVQHSLRPIDSLPGTPGGIAPLLKHMASPDWQEKLVFLDEFETRSGSDVLTALTRFCCGGQHDERMAAAERVLTERPENWLVLREIENVFRVHGDEANAKRFAKAAQAAHAAIVPALKRRRAAAKRQAKPETAAAPEAVAAPRPAKRKAKIASEAVAAAPEAAAPREDAPAAARRHAPTPRKPKPKAKTAKPAARQSS